MLSRKQCPSVSYSSDQAPKVAGSVAFQDKALNRQQHQIRDKAGLLQGAFVEIKFANKKATLKKCKSLLEAYKHSEMGKHVCSARLVANIYH